MKITHRFLADRLGVSESAVKQYNKEKRELMKKGLEVEFLKFLHELEAEQNTIFDLEKREVLEKVRAEFIKIFGTDFQRNKEND